MTTVLLKRGADGTWTSKDPVLADGEPGYSRDTGSFSIGDGVTQWSKLPRHYPLAFLDKRYPLKPTQTGALGWDTSLNNGQGGFTYGTFGGGGSSSTMLVATDPTVFAGSGFAPMVADGWEQTTTTGTDNTGSFNWLIGQAKATGKAISLPPHAPGRAYAIDGLVDASGVSVIGTAGRTTVITQRTKTLPVLVYGGTDCILSNVFLSRPARNFLTDRAAADVTANTQKNICGLRIGRAGIGCRIWDVNIWRSTTGIWCKENLDSSPTQTTYMANADLQRIHVGQMSPGGYGYFLNGTAGSTTFVLSNCYVSNGDNPTDVLAAGYYFGNLDELHFVGNNLEWTTAKYGAVIDGVATSYISNWHIEGYKAGSDNGAAVYVAANSNSKWLKWENIELKNCKLDKTYNSVATWSLVLAERGVDVELAGLQSTTGTETAAAGNQSTIYFLKTTTGVTRPMVIGTRALDTKSPGLTWSGNSITTGTGGSVTVIDRDAPSSGSSAPAAPFAVTIGDGAATSFVVTHNLGTKDVTVTVYSTGTTGEEHEPVIEHTSTNTVTVRYNKAPTAASVRVVVR